MSSIREFFEQEAKKRHEDKLKDGFIPIPASLRKYFNNYEYIHKTEIIELKNLLKSVK